MSNSALTSMSSAESSSLPKGSGPNGRELVAAGFSPRLLNDGKLWIKAKGKNQLKKQAL
jgi:hypothetical protein